MCDYANDGRHQSGLYEEDRGYDGEESDWILRFLFDYITKKADFHYRVRYEAGTVLVWDERVTHHSQTLDYPVGEGKYAFRLTIIANKPIPAMIEEDDGECGRDGGGDAVESLLAIQCV